MKLIKSFYKVSENYWVELDIINYSILRFQKIVNEKKISSWDNTTLAGVEINSILNTNLNEKKKFFITYNDKALNIFKKDLKIVFLKNRVIHSIDKESSIISNGFRINLKEKM